MKMKSILTLNDALVHLLRGLFDGEAILQRAIPECSKSLSSEVLTRQLKNYAEDSHDKMLKLERIFSYLMTSPSGKRNIVMEKMINDTHDMLEATISQELKDIILISCIQSINHYKISGYRTALSFAIELQLETVSDLLHEILEAEKQMDQALSKMGQEKIYHRLSV